MGDTDKGPLFKVSFEEAIEDYEPAPVCLKIRSKAAANPSSSSPEIDTSEPFTFTVTSEAEPRQELKDCLEFSETEVLPGLVVRFYVEPSQKLQDSANVNRIVREPFVVRVKVKLKSQIKGGAQKTLSGQFRVKVESRVKIHWKWEGHPLGFSDLSGKDNPIILQPDGMSWFKLKVWTIDWNPTEQKLVLSDPESYEFSHWIASGDTRMNTKVFSPKPLPWEIPRKNKQDENDWYSKVDLPDLAQFPTLNQLPIDTVMRVKAWNRGSIKVRKENDVDADQAEVGEVEIPVRLVKFYNLFIAVVLEGDDKPLNTYQERVNGEKVAIYCPNLPTDLKAKIRWKVTGPVHYFAGKRKFQREDVDTQLVPLTAPSGKECLGAKIEIVDGPCSSADPPVYLDIEAPVFEPNLEFSVTKDSILGDENDYTTARVKLLSTRADGTLDKVSELKAIFSVSVGGKLFQAVKSDFSAPPLKSPHGAQTDVKADWAEKDGKITIAVEVEVILEGRQNSEPLKAKASTQVEVIGANPEVALEASPESADADGVSTVTITPKLKLFQKTYENDLIIRGEDLIFSDAYFRPLADEPSLGFAILHCKFRLSNGPFRKIGKRTTRVRINSVYLADKEYGDHYPNGISARGRAGARVEIDLNPCTIQCSSPIPNHLPGKPGDPRRWKSRLAARVLSASKRPVPDEVILKDSSAAGLTGENCRDAGSFDYFQWYFKCAFDAPEPAWLKVLDEVGGSCAIRISQVDEQGRIHFKDGQSSAEVPYCDYDHFQEFFDQSKQRLKGQGCTVKATFDGHGELFPSGNITIGVVDEKSYFAKFRVIAQSEEPLKGAVVTVRDFNGTEESGETDSSGETTITGIARDCGPYTITAYKHTEPTRGRVGHKAESDPFSVELKEEDNFFEIILPCSTQWSLQGHCDWSIEVLLGYTYYQFTLFNRATKGVRLERERRRRITFHCLSVGLGTSAPLASGSGDENSPGILKNEPEPFETVYPVHFADFGGSLGYVATNFELNLLVLGWASQYASFADVDHGEEISIGGFQMGAAGVDLSSRGVGTWVLID